MYLQTHIMGLWIKDAGIAIGAQLVQTLTVHAAEVVAARLTPSPAQPEHE